MKPTLLILTAMGLAAFTSQPSFADCVDMTGSTDTQARTGIAKDGTHAPLEGTAGTQAKTDTPTGTTTTSTDVAANKPQKEGGTLPMGESNNLATSSQDVVAQQKGGETAASSATKDKCD